MPSIKIVPSMALLEVLPTTNEVNICNLSVIDKLHDMRLSAMSDAFECQCRDSDTYPGLSFEGCFGMLVDREWDKRKGIKLQRYIACALGSVAYRNFIKVLLCTSADLLNGLVVAYGDGMLKKVIKAYQKINFLIL